MRRYSFLIRIITIGILMHLYVGVRLVPVLPGSPAVRDAAVACLGLSIILILFGMLAQAIERQPLSDWLAWAGMLAMGFFSSLLVLTFARDVALLFVHVLDAALAAHWPLEQWQRNSAPVVPALALLASLAGFVNARRRAGVVTVEVPIDGLPNALDGFTIAQISDIHVGPTIKRDYVEAIVEAVNALRPDLIALTGDIVDGRVEQLAPHTRPLGQLQARHGVFLVTGNHEYYCGAHAWIDEFERLGLTVLMNQHVVIGHGTACIVVAGVTDYSAGHFDAAHASDPAGALRGAPPHAAVRILLAHQPRTASAAVQAGYTLQLSGHTHGGQFFPWNFFVRLQQPFTAGLHRLSQLWVYTSRGTGYWGPPKRIGAPSEITLVRLVPARAGSRVPAPPSSSVVRAARPPSPRSH
ncbi:metallophosphoesterase [Mycetohabitans rhizoxinica]|uniref:metallophosphoesterase n=1 Tax=Mycetohabitans rhizoxinica TaxID=412963 RepID=UPI0030CFB40A